MAATLTVLAAAIFIAGIMTGISGYQHFLRGLHKTQIHIRTIQRGGKAKRR